MPRPPPDPSIVFELLDLAAIPHTATRDESGRPLAELALRLRDGSTVPVAAGVRGKELRLTAHGLRPCSAETGALVALGEINDEWAFGRAYLNRSTHQLDASMSLYLGSGLPGADDMSMAWRHLAEAAATLRDGGQPGLALYSTDIEATRQRLRSCLDALGLAWEETPGSDLCRVGFEQRGLPQVLGFYVHDDGLLNLRAQLAPGWRLPALDTGLLAVQDLNRALSYGSVGLGPDTLRPHYHLGVPLLWSTLDEDLVHWGISKSLYVLVELLLPLVQAPPGP